MDFIPLASPDIHEEDIASVIKVLHSGMLVQGTNVNEFEANICKYLNSEYASAVSNGTATLHLALLILGIGKGDEVIIPAFSYIATANVVELVGATPVFVDIDINTYNIDVNRIEDKITTRTKAIIPVHEFGLACDIKRVMQIALSYNLYVIEDAACALGAKQDGQYVGTFGDFGSFSFHPRKAISSGEGGILTSQNKIYDSKIKVLRNHGIKMIDNKMEFVVPGYNYRMTDFQAALVLSQLKRLNEIILYRQNLAVTYFNELGNKNFILPTTPEDRNHTWQTFHVLINESLSRDRIIEYLKENGIGTNYGAQCIPAQQYYYHKYKYNAAKDFPNAFLAYKQGLALPIYEKLDQKQIQYISSKINNLN